MASFLAEPGRFAQFIYRSPEGKALGFVEASIRTDYVNGTRHMPVAFLEGLYVKRESRRSGVARALVRAIERWAKSTGCRELASDASTRNRTSHAVHKSLGFKETERVVYFNKRVR
jgi:aminoglycoside 6'-N-acetyltransferase I